MGRGSVNTLKGLKLKRREGRNTNEQRVSVQAYTYLLLQDTLSDEKQ
jgi:hypothetical protein